MSTSKPDQLFSSELIRLLVGLIPLALPVLVWMASSFASLTSISASYYTAAHDIFVGLLFALGAFLFTYQGHEKIEAWMANLAALAAIVAAIFPTSCNTCQPDTTSVIHFGAGVTMFLVTVYFCLGPFSNAAKLKRSVEAGRRLKFYTLCGWAIILCMGILGVGGFILNAEIKRTWAFIFWGEFVMMWLFAFAWLVAAKWIPWFTNKQEDGPRLVKELELEKSSSPKPDGK